ncbi:hypothetical protein PVAR5_3976 [Paecilomyces variotii No. 5]|uniref:Uncharacterized protein n=1 Tax=Byssochlamys spectabilis (strain No. 5 / NBRC 109023) TaxID=1356009 RepID=V5FDI3_BYSSN|nr:hypothetical protein PVAR5_3976 [Paecilomyces variotii No. 5]
MDYTFGLPTMNDGSSPQLLENELLGTDDQPWYYNAYPSSTNAQTTPHASPRQEFILNTPDDVRGGVGSQDANQHIGSAENSYIPDFQGVNLPHNQPSFSAFQSTIHNVQHITHVHYHGSDPLSNRSFNPIAQDVANQPSFSAFQSTIHNVQHITHVHYHGSDPLSSGSFNPIAQDVANQRANMNNPEHCSRDQQQIQGTLEATIEQPQTPLQQSNGDMQRTPRELRPQSTPPPMQSSSKNHQCTKETNMVRQ